MSSSALEAGGSRTSTPQPAGIAVVTGSWSAAGGLAAGCMIAAWIALGQIHPDFVPAAALAALGSAFGALHGAVLGHLSRPAARDRPTLGHAWAAAAVFAIAGGALAVLGSVWLAMSAATARVGSTVGWAALVVGALCGAAIIAWATLLGWRAIRVALARWPDHGIGGWLTVGAFVLLTSTLLMMRPVFAGSGLSLSLPATVLLAGLATVWIALPAIALGLWFSHRHA